VLNLRRHPVILAGSILAAGALVASACDNQSAAVAADQNASNSILKQYEISQPVPKFRYSQYRQTLIDIETAEVDGSQTTTFFFNMGVKDPIQSCPSIGFPIASTSELTNPWQDDNNGPNGNAGVAIAQIDPNGVYTGDSTGTYVVCVAPNGSPYVDYWEGFVQSVSGPAVWDTASGKVKLTGPSSVSLQIGAK
jgi:hypothetical protein